MRKVVHVYFGNASKHPIITNYLSTGNYCRVVIDAPKSQGSRFRRMFHLAKRLFLYKGGGSVIFHSHDLLSFYLVKSIFPLKPVLFDSHEVYRSYFKGVGYIFAYVLEEVSTFVCTFKFLPSAERVGLYRFKEKLIVVENLFVPKSMPVSIDREQNSFVYAGLLSEKRCIRELVQLFEKSPSQTLTIFGGESPYMSEIIKNGLPANVVYKGEVTQDELLRELPKFTASFALYRPLDLNNKYPAPTKLFENEFLGIPTIVFNSQYIEALVEKNILRNTYLIDSVDEYNLKKILVDLKNNHSKPNVSNEILWSSQLPLIDGVYERMFSHYD